VAVSSVCSNRLVSLSGQLRIPYCSNRSLTTHNPAVRRAIIVVHGQGRNGPGYFQSMLDAAQSAGVQSETLIIAPHFLIEEDVQAHGLANDVPFWTEDGWKQGDDSLSTAAHPRAARESSFDFTFAILRDIGNRTVFPNITRVVLVGHSAGGQLVQRFAAAAGPAARIARYVVANPSSYLYMDGKRIGLVSAPPLCGNYNSYKYGLENLNRYMLNRGVNALRTQYSQAHVVYLLGADDRDPKDDDLDKSCPAAVQGAHRLERGNRFYEWLGQHYGGEIYGRHRKVIVPGVGHSAGGMFNSMEGIQQIFATTDNEFGLAGWHGWYGLGGAITDAPSTVLVRPGVNDIYARGTDNRLVQKWWDGARWNPSDTGWALHDDGGFRLGSAPCVVAGGDNHRDVFVRGQDGKVYHKVWDGQKWHGWFGLGGAIVGAPSAVFIKPGVVDIYVQGTDGRLWQKWWDGTRWNPSDEGWAMHDDGGFRLGSAPCVIARDANHRDVFVRGQDGRVYHKVWDGQKWHGWFGLGGAIVGAPSAVFIKPGNVDIYVQGTDGRLWQKWWDGTRWNPSDEGWVMHDDGQFRLGSSPAVIIDGPGTRDVYVRNRDGSVSHKYWVAE
jgi:hypothetical protein